LAVIVQLIHDVLFAQFFQGIGRGKSRILDTFKDYVGEMGALTILLADSTMIVSTILLASFFSLFSVQANGFFLIILLYIIPYFLYSINL